MNEDLSIGDATLEVENRGTAIFVGIPLSSSSNWTDSPTVTADSAVFDVCQIKKIQRASIMLLTSSSQPKQKGRTTIESNSILYQQVNFGQH